MSVLDSKRYYEVIKLNNFRCPRNIANHMMEKLIFVMVSFQFKLTVSEKYNSYFKKYIDEGCYLS